MAKILCIETSTLNCSVGIIEDGKVIALKEERSDKYIHAEKLHEFIKSAISDSGITPKQLDAVAVSKGPGSYTGLRIGVSAAKGMAFTLKIPLLSIGTLEMMAATISSSHSGYDFYLPMIDARRNEVYSLTMHSGEIMETVDARIIEADSLNQLEGKVLLFGDGAAKCVDILDHKNIHLLEDVFPSVTMMNAIATSKFSNQEFEDVAYFEPFYLKDFVAGKPKELWK